MGWFKKDTKTEEAEIEEAAEEETDDEEDETESAVSIIGIDGNDYDFDVLSKNDAEELYAALKQALLDKKEIYEYDNTIYILKNIIKVELELGD